MRELFCKYNISSGSFEDGSTSVFRYENTQAAILWIGNPSVGDTGGDAEKIIEYYFETNDKLPEVLSGTYILLIHDKEKNVVMAFHDRTTSSLTLYYVMQNNIVYMGTSLKRLLFESGIPRVFNEKSIRIFLVNGFIYGEDTLIKNVRKLTAFHALSVDHAAPVQIPVSYRLENFSSGRALDAYRSVLDDAILQCSQEGCETAAIALSNGYDSNYIAYVLCNETEKSIHAFSVGSKIGRNEIPAVMENVQFYEHMTLHTTITDRDSLRSLSDIIWRLEGAVYEKGIFLQYELAKQVAESGKRILICGECADQVLNKYYLQEDRIFPQNEGLLSYDFENYPYIFGSFLILKKNGILFNSFGIEPKYPYLDDRFVGIANSLKNINGLDKRCHVALCRDVLPEEVLGRIAKIGGATECRSLFESKAEINDFLRKVNKSELYLKYKGCLSENSVIEEQRGIQKIRNVLRNSLLSLLHIGVEKRKNTEYYKNEVRLNHAMKFAYLILFEKLFISPSFEQIYSQQIPLPEIFDLL